MNDLVERLRDCENYEDAWQLKQEAADEIERLRKALAEISLCSSHSASSKEECGRIARAALHGPEGEK